MGKRERSDSFDSYSSYGSSDGGSDSDAGLILWRDTGASILSGERVEPPSSHPSQKVHISTMRKPWIQKRPHVRVPNHCSMPIDNPPDKRAPYLCVVHGYIRKPEKHFSGDSCAWLQTDKGKEWLEKWKSDFNKVLPSPGQTFHEANQAASSKKQKKAKKFMPATPNPTAAPDSKEDLGATNDANQYSVTDGACSSDNQSRGKNTPVDEGSSVEQSKGQGEKKKEKKEKKKDKKKEMKEEQGEKVKGDSKRKKRKFEEDESVKKEKKSKKSKSKD